MRMKLPALLPVTGRGIKDSIGQNVERCLPFNGIVTSFVDGNGSIKSMTGSVLG